MKLRNTCLDVLGSYSGWVERHPEHLQAVFKAAVAELPHAATQAYAARLFTDVCDACGSHVGKSQEFLGAVLNVHRQALAASLPKKELLLITRGQWHALIGCYGRHRRPVARSNWVLWPTPQASGTL